MVVCCTNLHTYAFLFACSTIVGSINGSLSCQSNDERKKGFEGNTPEHKHTLAHTPHFPGFQVSATFLFILSSVLGASYIFRGFFSKISSFFRPFSAPSILPRLSSWVFFSNFSTSLVQRFPFLLFMKSNSKIPSHFQTSAF